MLRYLDLATSTGASPNENYSRELMELFSRGVGYYTESDVYAAARVFTGWNLKHSGDATDPNSSFAFVFNAAQHETSAKTFSFPVYPDGTSTIPARAASGEVQKAYSASVMTSWACGNWRTLPMWSQWACVITMVATLAGSMPSAGSASAGVV